MTLKTKNIIIMLISVGPAMLLGVSVVFKIRGQQEEINELKERNRMNQRIIQYQQKQLL